MARKITAAATRALIDGHTFKSGNTEVILRGAMAVLTLHGNEIARRFASGKLSVSVGGHNSLTTRERLNGIPGVYVHVWRGMLFLNGEQWAGEWKIVRPV
jgi:hypothetical protein